MEPCYKQLRGVIFMLKIKNIIKGQRSAVLLFGTLLTMNVFAEDPGLPLHGFADAGGGFSGKNTPSNQKINGFKIGTVDFYLSPEFDDGVKSLIEIAFEPNHETGEIGVDVERLQVGYTFNDHLTLWAGRFHTPYGVWNTSYHHGSQLQTSIYRPKFLDFEDNGGIIPAHSVGLWGKGQFKLDKSKISYNVYVVNGSRIILNTGSAPGTLDMNNYRNDKSHYMVGGSLSYDFLGGAVEGLGLGVHGFSTDIGSYTKNDYSVPATNATKVLMLGGFVHYEQHGIEFLTEYYGFSDKNANGSSATAIKSNAMFTQVGYNATESLTPFVRYEKTALNNHDSYFADQASGQTYNRYALGLRKDVNPKAAFKLEWMQTPHDGTNKKYDIFQYNYAFRF
jgi:hypothetical protein